MRGLQLKGCGDILEVSGLGSDLGMHLNDQTSHQKILAELEAATATLEALTPACRAELQKLTPDLKQALAQLEQAECNLKLLQQK
jgi:multidrug resistance efflux pump